MTDKELLEEIISEQLNLSREDINDYSTLEELGAEDEDCYEILDSVKEEFDVEIEESIAYELTIIEWCDILLERYEA